MKSERKAAFTLESFKFKKFSFDDFNIVSEEDSLITIDPEGIYSPSTNEFELTIIFRAFKGQDESKVSIYVEQAAVFKFVEDTPFDQIPSYFYSNAIAIIFPYLRAFVTNLTVQANDRILVLPTLNLSNLAEPLKKKSRVAE